MILYILSSGAGLLAAQRITIDSHFKGGIIGDSMEVYRQSHEGAHRLSQLADASFEAVSTKVPIFGYSLDTFWFRLRLENQTAMEQILYLELFTAWIDHFNLYRQGQQSIELISKAGFAEPEQAVKSQYPAHKIILAPHASEVYYLEVRSPDALILPINLFSESHFQAYYRNFEMAYGVFIGIMLLAAFYGVIFFVFTGNPSYIFYGLLSLNLIYMFANFDNLIPAFFKENYALTKSMNVISVGLVMILGAYLVNHFLQLKAKLRWFYRLNHAWALLQWCLIMATLFFDYHTMMALMAFSCILWPFTLIGSALAAHLKKSQMAKYYLLSWSFPCTALIIYNSTLFGLVPTYAITPYLLHVGVAAEMVFLSFILSYHLKVATQESSRLKVSIDSAARIHSSLMGDLTCPAELILQYRYLPSHKIGGDFVGLLADPRGVYAYAVISDVTGHGLDAAILSAIFSGALHASVENLADKSFDLQTSAVSIASAVNQVLHRHYLKNNHCASMSMVALSLQDGEAVYLNAGHRPVFHRNLSGVHGLLRPGSLLGLRDSANFGISQFQIAIGDRLIFYSDGLVENHMNHRNSLSEKWLKQSIGTAITLEATVDEIWQAAAKQADVHLLQDDMSLMAIELQALRPKPASAA